MLVKAPLYKEKAKCVSVSIPSSGPSTPVPSPLSEYALKQGWFHCCSASGSGPATQD